MCTVFLVYQLLAVLKSPFCSVYQYMYMSMSMRISVFTLMSCVVHVILHCCTIATVVSKGKGYRTASDGKLGGAWERG